jgi:hypothetical protein
VHGEGLREQEREMLKAGDDWEKTLKLELRHTLIRYHTLSLTPRQLFRALYNINILWDYGELCAGTFCIKDPMV